MTGGGFTRNLGRQGGGVVINDITTLNTYGVPSVVICQTWLFTKIGLAKQRKFAPLEIKEYSLNMILEMAFPRLKASLPR